jgi:ligand-binding SRPBCC domain-containing protein
VTIFELRTAQLLPRPREEVFAFFAAAENLEVLTPPWLGFQILTPLPLALRKGTLLDYRIRLHRIPIRWRTEITAWEPPRRFVDEQLRGPYRLWVHEHTFAEVPGDSGSSGGNGGTRVADRVRYAVPGGRLVNQLLVARDLRKIFEYRNRKIQGIFGSMTGGDEPVQIQLVEAEKPNSLHGSVVREKDLMSPDEEDWDADR